MISFWRQVGETFGLLLPSDETMGHGPLSPQHTLCNGCGNYTKTSNNRCVLCNERKE